MGSRFSKALRPHPKAAALPVAIAQPYHEIDGANADGARTDPTPHWPRKFYEDDTNLAAFTPTQSTPQRRNSAPETTAAMEQLQSRTAAFNLFLAEHSFMSIQYADTDLAPSPLTLLSPPPQVLCLPQPPPVVEPEVQCLICCTQLPDEKDPKHAAETIKPCRSCTSTYCINCVKKMFTEACKDSTRMPPRCCTQIQLHLARPYLSKEEVAEFKTKYEEWSTPNAFYCPIPTCSIFIPERLLPEQAKSKGKRVDSGIGTPTASAFACPTCVANICAACRQVAHPDSMCNVGEYGLDEETTALLKRWGYKKCPKCGHGLKRMYGCNHMECRCGAHFCWVCLRSRDDCDGGCSDDEEEEYDSDDEPDAPEPLEETTALSNATDTAVSTSDEDTVVEAININATEDTTFPQPSPRIRNLDGGGQRYWEELDLQFGDEPTDDIQDRGWHCQHSFATYKISLAQALANNPAIVEMECTKCWCAIHPEVEAPKTNTKASRVLVRAGAAGPNRGGISRGQVRGRGGGGYIAPRGLFRADATVGTAPHLTATISLLSQSAPARETSPMEDIQYAHRVVDTYGNIIATTEVDTTPRRASLDHHINVNPHIQDRPDKKSSARPAGLFASPPLPFSFAHECRQCGLLVCATCKDAALPKQQQQGAVGEEEEEEEEQQQQPTDIEEVEFQPSLFD